METAMNEGPAPETDEIAQNVRDFVRGELFPLEKEFSSRSFGEMKPALEEKRKAVKALGLWAPQLPAEHGGMGLSLPDFALVSEELGQSPIGHYVFNCQAPDAGNLELLIEHGTEAQKETWLRPLAAGDIRSSFSMTEPDYPGSNPVWMGTTARRDGGDYVIDGRKWFVTGADGCAFTIVMAVTAPDAENKYLRASQIVVPADNPGFRLVRNLPVMGHCGEDYATHGEVAFENCRVPVENRIGPEGAGFALAQERLGPGRIHHCMRWIGICERAFDLMCRRAVSRLLAPGKPLASRQTVQEWIAESRAEIDAARFMVLAAARKVARDGAHGARVEISTIKFFVANTMQRVLDRAIQTHGGFGMTSDTPLAHWYAHERAARIYDGPDEVHKAVAARAILKKYGFDPRKS